MACAHGEEGLVALAERLAEARAAKGYAQADVAAALGVSRAMISYWESATRQPSDLQLAALARLFRIDASRLLQDEPLRPEVDEARMLLRSSATQLSSHARMGLDEFLAFLDAYSSLASSAGFGIRGMTHSPFGLVRGFQSAEDARRKAEEVRAHLRLGMGPIGDLDRVCELLGITVFRAPLGEDLSATLSGAFFNHPDVGFSILVNLEMTPGRRRFTTAHEIAHGLFHSDDQRFVISGPDRTPEERFADIFAGEFLMPTEGLRRVMEEHGVGPRIEEPADVVHLQRFFDVSYGTALVRLRQSKLVSPQQLEEFQGIRPVAFARELGYDVGHEEITPDVERWRIRRFPPKFLGLVRSMIRRDIVSSSSVAGLMGVTIDEIEELVSDRREEDPGVRDEVGEFFASGVLGD